MFGKLKTLWNWLTQPKCPPEGCIYGIDVGTLKSAVGLLQTDVGTLSEHLARQGERVDRAVAEGNGQVRDFMARLDDLEKSREACSFYRGRDAERFARAEDRLAALERREDGYPALAGCLDRLAGRLDALERWRHAPGAAVPRILPVPGGREAKDGYDASPCPFCRQRLVVSCGSRWTCDGCRSCGEKDNRGYTVMVAPAPKAASVPASPEDEAGRLYDVLLAHPARLPSREGWIAQVALELRRFLMAHTAKEAAP